MATHTKDFGKITTNVFENDSDYKKNAGYHNSIYRGKYLGTAPTADMYSEISAGTFGDLFIGDYFAASANAELKWVIAAFDYWLHCGDTECTAHHVVIVPSKCLDTQKMNDSSTTTGGYYGSKMYSTNLATAKSTINTAFGSAHILSHKALLTNAVASDKASGWAWYDSTVDLMNESMVYGHSAWGAHHGYETAIDKGQLPLFALEPGAVVANGPAAGAGRASWWLRDVVSGTNFAFVTTNGYAYSYGAENAFGVRPAFGIRA